MENHSLQWKMSLLLGMVVCVVVVILEGGARLLIRYQMQKSTAANETSKEAPIKVQDMSDLDKVHVAGPGISWVMKPNLRDYQVTGRCCNRDVQFTLSTNEQGLRNPPLAPDGERIRILALGDSTTFGLGVNDGETWPAQLERILNEKAGKAQFEVLNAGVSGTTAFQGLQYLEKLGLSFGPRVVIACFGHNEIEPYASKPDIELAMEKEEIARHEVGKIGSGFLVLARRALKQTERKIESVTSGSKNRLTESDFHDSIVQMKKVCDSKNIRFMFLLWPYEPQVSRRDPGLMPYQAVILQTCREIDTPLLNLYDAFVQATEPIYVDPLHTNATGCRLAAEAIAQAITPLLGARN